MLLSPKKALGEKGARAGRAVVSPNRSLDLSNAKIVVRKQVRNQTYTARDGYDATRDRRQPPSAKKLDADEREYLRNTSQKSKEKSYLSVSQSKIRQHDVERNEPVPLPAADPFIDCVVSRYDGKGLDEYTVKSLINLTPSRYRLPYYPSQDSRWQMSQDDTAIDDYSHSSRVASLSSMLTDSPPRHVGPHRDGYSDESKHFAKSIAVEQKLNISQSAGTCLFFNAAGFLDSTTTRKV
jgi:hypothetical protein